MSAIACCNKWVLMCVYMCEVYVCVRVFMSTNATV